MTAPTIKKKKGFWTRQFAPEVTRRQLIFDVVFGIIAPVLCLIFDPFVFTSDPTGLLTSPLASFRVFAYLAIGLGTCSLTVWLIAGSRLKPRHPFFTGVFFLGALLAFGVGLVLLPLSIVGLLMIIGVFGFIPFLTAFVYWRNSRRAFKRMETIHPITNRTTFVVTVVLAWVVVLALPTLAQWQTSRIVSSNVQSILHGDAVAAAQGVQNLKNAFWCSHSCYAEIVNAYRAEHDSARRFFLAKAYQEITGRDIQMAIWRFAD